LAGVTPELPAVKGVVEAILRNVMPKTFFKVSMVILAGLLPDAGKGIAHANGIEFGETKSRYEVRRSAETRTLLDAKTMLQPWYVDWRHTVAWQHGIARPRPYFAPAGCFIVRRVVTPYDVTLKSMYICR
jgi:hypothetical protein